MLEILNSGMYASPIIVFVNQKKTADMVAKDLQRAGVSGMVSFHLDQSLISSVVECCDAALRQEPRAARGRSAIIAFRRCRYPVKVVAGFLYWYRGIAAGR